MTAITANGVSQNGKAKSEKAHLAAQIARLVRRQGLTYDGWRYVSKEVRKLCQLRPVKKGRKLPLILNADEFRHFYQIVDQADNVQHSLMLRLLFFTAVRVSELCAIEVGDVDLENFKIRVNQGKGSKDRYVLFGKGFATALRTHIAAHPKNRWLFQTRLNRRYSSRRVQQIVSAPLGGHPPDQRLSYFMESSRVLSHSSTSRIVSWYFFSRSPSSATCW